ncbi:translocation/assembly module TamB domain-containing protein [Paradevosia shaoguanensis]|uniref:translocation/assembly module TamB domain-containing protein n=1 Tax=Paradevosia shaoguanensis TaxID=1335043 RepID=UPI0019339550|nr:translocation/assembly module TamB domain-containing protein [Paradevosia shaoguanensis]
MRRLLAFLLFALALVVAAPAFAQAQPDAEAEKNGFLRFVQDRLSTPDRIIRISNIDGALSSDASIAEITIADPEGVWLRIVNAKINWNQAALLLGRLEINTLSADSIEFLRNSAPPQQSDLPSPEAGGLSIPQFPVSINIGKISVPKITFGQQVFGLGSEISLEGALRLDGGSLDTTLDIVRLDGPGGTLNAKVVYQAGTQNLDLNIALAEPKDGIIANLLNIDGRPDVKFTLAGSGQVKDLRTDLTFDAGGQRVLSGVATINQVAEGFDVGLDLHGPIATLVDEPFRPFFGADSLVTGRALIRSEGGIDLTGIKLSGGQLALTADARTTPDGFLRQLALSAQVASPDGSKVLLPVPGAQTQVQSADLKIDFGAENSENWSAALNVVDFDGKTFATKALTFKASGVAANLDDPAQRRVTFNGDGSATGLTATNPDIQAALGDTIGFGIAGLWNAGQPVRLAQLLIEGKALDLALAGTIDNWVYDGDVAIRTANIAPFSDMAGRPLAGALDLKAKGTISPLVGGFNLNLDGTGTDLAIGEETADRLLAGEVRLTGRVARTEQGLETQDFNLGNQQVQLTANGNFATGTADFRFDLGLADLALLSKDASGALKVSGTAKGQDNNIALNLDAGVAQGALSGRNLQDGKLGFAGTLREGVLAGAITGNAFLDGHRIDLAADISADEQARNLTNLDFNAGGTRLTGGISQDKAGLLTGQLQLASSNVSTAAALFLREATGAANASISLTAADGKQAAAVSGTVEGLATEGIRIGAADIQANIADLFGIPQVQGSLTGSNISAAGVDVATVSASANLDGNTTNFDGQAALVNGTNLALAGALAPLDAGYRLSLDKVTLNQGQLSASLAQPTTLMVNGDTVSMDAIQFNVGSGRITATGTAGNELAIDLTINALPLSVANAVAPDLALSGTLNGTARIGGTRSSPQASFTLAGQGIDAAALRPIGIAPVSFSTSGNFANDTVRLASLTANGAGGLSISGNGTVPLKGNGLALNLTGSAPLSLANRFVADRGGQASGTVSLNARVSGSISAPQFAGEVSTRNAQYIDPLTNLRLNNITGSATLTGERATINSLTASLATGGSIAVSGTVGLKAPAFTTDLTLNLNDARYADGDLVVATMSGALNLRGPLLQGPLLSGNILVRRADISIPERLGGGGAVLDVTHKAPSPEVTQTLARAKVDVRPGGAPAPRERPSAIQLDVTINAPNQVFIRGRGLDAELGGALRLTGPVTNVQPVGGFDLIRGRLSILGQRVVFESGSVTLSGNLDPDVHLVASTQGDGITVYVTVSGTASDINVTFTSDPALPQDEVLARLIFNRSMGELSPLQLARLAGAAAELAGGGGGDLVGSLRDAAGLADLDIVTDAKGNVAVQAGSYIQDNVYLGVQAGANGQSKVTVNLDITNDLKAKAALGADGNSSVGVFYEKDY